MLKYVNFVALCVIILVVKLLFGAAISQNQCCSSFLNSLCIYAAKFMFTYKRENLDMGASGPCSSEIRSLHKK